MSCPSSYFLWRAGSLNAFSHRALASITTQVVIHIERTCPYFKINDGVLPLASQSSLSDQRIAHDRLLAAWAYPNRRNSAPRKLFEARDVRLSIHGKILKGASI